MNQPLLQHFDLLATAPGGVARLRELILTLAVRGKLVPQDPADEPASVLLQKIRTEKDRLIAEGKIKRDKPLAPITDKGKPFELPQGWAWSTLATVGVINPRNDAPDDTVASFVQMSSIPVAFTEPHLVEPRPWREIKSGFTQFAEGDVGVAKITPCFENGKSTVFQNLSNGIGAGTTELHIVRPLGGISPRYVLLFLKTPGFLIGGEAVMTGSAGQKRLPRAYFENKPFPLPPQAEQSRIVARVEELMRLCDALEAKGKLDAEQHAQLLRTLLGTLTDSASPAEQAANWQRVAEHFDLLLDRPEAVDALEQTLLQLAVRGLLLPQDPSDEPASVLLQKIRTEKDRLIAEGKIKRDKPLAPITEEEKPFELPLGWEWVRLNAMLQKIGAGSTPRGGKEVYVTSGVKFLRSQNVWDDGLRLAGVAFIRPETHAKMSGTVVVADDLLFNITGASIGRCAVVPSDFDEANVSQHVTIVRSVLPAINAFLHKVLVSQHVQQAVMAAQVGVSREGLSIAKLGNFLIPVPPLAEQSRIVSRVEELRQLCTDLRQRLTASRATQGQLAQTLVETAL